VRGVRFRGLRRWRGSFEVLVYFVDGLIDFFTLATFEGCYFPIFLVILISWGGKIEVFLAKHMLEELILALVKCPARPTFKSF
jgi:hypothetical protein